MMAKSTNPKFEDLRGRVLIVICSDPQLDPVFWVILLPQQRQEVGEGMGFVPQGVDDRYAH